jgi:hypothetical protein
MRPFRTIFGLALALVIAPTWATANDSADQGQQLQGVVQSVTGSRLSIQTTDRGVVEATLEFPAPADIVGQQVSGTLLTRGDTYFLSQPAFSPSSP